MEQKQGSKRKPIETSAGPESGILIGVATKQQDEEQLKEYLDELEFLASTAGIVTLKRFTQKLDRPDIRTFVGAGKLQEIKNYVVEKGVKVVIFDDDLSPSVIRNVEKELGCKILDRTNLILDIFADRAQTAHAKTQVLLAQYQYMLPRLTGLWTHLERQRGGTGTRSGAGEKEIETDRRIVRDKIAALKEQLSVIDRQMATQRKNRGDLIRVALVGYTNVGKSTIMNMLSKSEVLAENKLFATLDTTVRKVVLNNVPFLLSDTVGFIRKLPTHLVESFKSTLDEVREADILIHVVDISHPNFEDQLNVVNQTLLDIGIYDKAEKNKEARQVDKPTILVFNKIDAYTYEEKEEDDLTPITKRNLSLEQLRKSWMSKIQSPCVFISATDKKNMDEFKSLLYTMVKDLHQKRYPYNNLLY